MIENLNRSERLGVLENVDRWLEARQLRIRLVHEYMDNPASFAADPVLARDYCKDLFATFKRLRDFAATHMGISRTVLPVLPDPDAGN